MEKRVLNYGEFQLIISGKKPVNDHAYILMYGVDLPLLASRKLILARNGCKVEITYRFEDFELSLRNRDAELCILCHSLSGDQCMNAIGLIEELSPETRILSLRSWMDEKKFTQSEHIEVLDTFMLPETLIQTVLNLTKQVIQSK